MGDPRARRTGPRRPGTAPELGLQAKGTYPDEGPLLTMAHQVSGLQGCPYCLPPLDFSSRRSEVFVGIMPIYVPEPGDSRFAHAELMSST